MFTKQMKLIMEEASIGNRGVRNGLAQAEGIWEREFLSLD